MVSIRIPTLIFYHVLRENRIYFVKKVSNYFTTKYDKNLKSMPKKIILIPYFGVNNAAIATGIT